METKELDKRPNIDQDKKLTAAYAYFETLLIELKKKEIPSEIASSINVDIQELNSFSGSNIDLLKQLKKRQSSIFKLLEKELKLVPKNLYRNRWLVIGMSVFGIPFGLLFGISLGNMAFIGIGIPLGMVIGIAIGTGMDKKAFEEGKQLDIEIKL